MLPDCQPYGPAEGDLDHPGEIGERARGPDEDAPPEKGGNVPDPDGDQRGVGRGGYIHGTAMVSDQWQYDADGPPPPPSGAGGG